MTPEFSTAGLIRAAMNTPGKGRAQWVQFSKHGSETVSLRKGWWGKWFPDHGLSSWIPSP
jgi:hypothetical protein